MKIKTLFLLAFIQTYGLAYSQNCSSRFISHQSGSIITTYPVTINGSAAIPNDGHVWILAHLEGFNGWYPQGNGERSLTNETWTCTVYLGTPGETGYYEIAIAIVNDQVNQALNNWVSTAKDRGYPPIPLPNVLYNCPINRIRVEKR